MLRHSMSGLLVVAFVLLIFVPGCSRNPITVDGEGISKEVFDLALKERMDMHKAMNVKIDDKALRKSVADELVAEALLVKEAKAKKIAVTDDELQKTIDGMRGNMSEADFKEHLKKSTIPYEAFRTRVKNKIYVSKLTWELVKDDSVTEEQLKDFYTKSQVPFLKPERDNVRILQFKDEAEAKAVAERIKKGEDFDAVADSLAKSGKASTTSYGWVQPDMFSPEISTAIKHAKLNAAQGPLKSKDGSFYLFNVKEKEAPKVMSFEEAKPQIRNTILNQKRQDAMGQIIEAQKKTAKIQINV